MKLPATSGEKMENVGQILSILIFLGVLAFSLLSLRLVAGEEN